VTQRAYKYRFYPTIEQAASLNRTFGSARFIWNKSLAIRIEAWEQRKERISGIDVMRMLTQWKKDPETAWLSDVSAVVLQQTLRDQDQAFKNFFTSCSGKRKGPKVGYPRFKARATARKSVRFVGTAFAYRNGHIFLAKMMSRPLPIEWSRPLPKDARPSSVTVSLDPSGRWFISILCNTDIEVEPQSGESVGIDLGLKTFAILSDETVVEHPSLLRRKEARLKRYQRSLSRKAKGSKNRAKARVKVAKAHAKVSDARRDFLHKASTDIVERFDVIAIEDLNVKGMVRNHSLARSISDSGWGEFRSMLEYKAKWYGKTVVVIGRFFPSSQLCFDCGARNTKLRLADRSWVCGACGTLHDRDLNAARNILAEGHSVLAGNRQRACGAGVGPTVPSGAAAAAMKQELTEMATLKVA